MDIKENRKLIGISSVVFLVIYLFVAAIPMGPDIFFVPVWTKAIPENTQPAEQLTATAGNSGSGIEAFIIGQQTGYFTPDGQILSSRHFDVRASATPFAWTVYPQNASNTPVFLPDGTLKMTIAESGFVHLDENRTYLFLPGGNGVSQIADDGKKIWTREHTAPITAFNSSKGGTIIGYADGQLTAIGNDGTVLFSFYPGGSNFQVILGAAISEDGTLAACVSGIDKQRFILIQISANQHKIIYHRYLDGNLRRQAVVDFEKTGRYAFFETAHGLGVVDCHSLFSGIVPVEGHLLSVGDSPENSLFVVLSRTDSTFVLSAIERPDHLVASTRFTAQNAFLIQQANAIYLGTDMNISRIDIRGVK